MTETNGSAGPGARLKEARVAIDVNTREVADALNLPIDVIDAIEADAHDRLPAPVFTRGYIRAYAKLLDLDAEPLVTTYQAPETETSASLLMDEPAKLSLHRFVGPVIGGSVVLVIIVILVVITVVWPGGEAPDTEADASQLSALSEEPVEPSPATFEDAGSEAVVDLASAADTPDSTESNGSTPHNNTQSNIDPVGATVGTTVGTTVEATVEATVGESIADQAIVEDRGIDTDTIIATRADTTIDTGVVATSPAVTRADTAPVTTPATRTRRLTPGGDNRLMLTFTEECWVEVKDLDGRRLYSNLSRAGTELQLIGFGPFRVLLGYAPGATLAYNGETVPLTPHTRDNVANLMVGQ